MTSQSKTAESESKNKWGETTDKQTPKTVTLSASDNSAQSKSEGWVEWTGVKRQMEEIECEREGNRERELRRLR